MSDTSKLQSNIFLRRQGLDNKINTLPDALQEKHAKLELLVNFDEDELEEDALKEIEIEITAKDTALLRELRRHVRSLRDLKQKENQEAQERQQKEESTPKKSSWQRWF